MRSEGMSDGTTDAVSVERQKLAKALHDTLCQEFTGMSFLAHSLSGSLEQENNPLSEEACRLRDLLEIANNNLRAILIELQSSPEVSR